MHTMCEAPGARVSCRSEPVAAPTRVVTVAGTRPAVQSAADATVPAVTATAAVKAVAPAELVTGSIARASAVVPVLRTVVGAQTVRPG